MNFQLRSIKDAHSDFGTVCVWINESQILTCADDHRINLWNIHNFIQIKSMKLPDDFFVTDLALFNSNQSLSANSSKRTNQISQQNQLKAILACSDGKFHIINLTFEKIENSIDAHQGAIICLRLLSDESSILTSGEDGQLKIWSKSGLLRNTIATESSPIYCAHWSNDQMERVLYSTNDQLNIRPLAPNNKTMKTIKWIAHKGYVIRCVDWNSKYKLILSSDELGNTKLWNSIGTHLKTVDKKDNLIPSSLAWSKDGEKFAAGGYNFILLGDRHGHLISIQSLNERKKTKDNEISNIQLDIAQSLMRIDWSNNSLAAISTSGQLFHGFIVNEIIQWSSYSIQIIDFKKILLKNILIDNEQELEFNDPIVKCSVKFDHLIVLSINQCYVYALPKINPLDRKSLNSSINPTIIQLKDSNYYSIQQSCNQFALINLSNIVFFNYDGRQKFPFKLTYGNKFKEELNNSMISLSDDTIAFRDPLDNKVIRFFDSSNGFEFLRNKEKRISDRRSSATRFEFNHEQEIVSLSLNNCSSSERMCAFIDKNQDLYLTFVRPTSMKNCTIIKLTSMCTSIEWNERFDLLVSIEQNTKLNIFIYPQSAFLDNDLFRISTISKNFDQNDHQFLNVISFQEDQIRMMDEKNSSIVFMISPCYLLLHDYVNKNRFDLALKLCRLNFNDLNSYEKRSSNDISLWATFTAMSLDKRNLEMTEIGYASVEIFERVVYIKNIKKIYEQLSKNEAVNSMKLMAAEALKKGELALLSGGNYLEAETIFLNAGFVIRCLFMYLNLFRWFDALQLAKKYDRLCTDDLNKFLTKINRKDLIDTDEDKFLSRIVCTYRINYLERFELDETDKLFINLIDQLRPLDWETVEQIQNEQYSFRSSTKKI